MPDRIARLLSSLKLLARMPSIWMTRRGLGDGQPTAHINPGLDGRVGSLRRAFPLADAGSIGALAAICSPMPVHDGTPLVLEGQQPDAVYIVVAGLFAAYQHTSNGQEVLLDRFGAGDVIGDTSFITGEMPAANIRALRNSELLRLPKRDILAAAARCPGALVAICSGAVRRLQRAQRAYSPPPGSRTFCLVPADATIDTTPIIHEVARTLGVFGSVTIVSAAQMAGRTSTSVPRIETGSQFVLLQADPSPTAWTQFCLRQCDRIVLVAQGDTDPAECDALGVGQAHFPNNTPLSLMLLWQTTIVPGRTTAWLRLLDPIGHHHIRSPLDIERASRLIAGRGLGLVLSGGGARALAHVGVIDALRQHGIQIDAVGGTSVGGIVAAVFALEWDLAATIRSLAAAFSRRRFSDFAVPRTALYSDRAFARTLGHCFGDLAIEDSPIPMFCVSTNLTRGMSAVHRTGRLVTWLRATSAVPGICPPIMERNNIYVDGGVLRNMPTDAIRDFGVATAIAVDAGSSLEDQARSDGGGSLPTLLDLLWRVGSIASDTAGSRPHREGDVVLKPEIGNMGIFDWNAHERVVAAGYQVAVKHLDEIKAAAAGSRLNETPAASEATQPEFAGDVPGSQANDDMGDSPYDARLGPTRVAPPSTPRIWPVMKRA